MKLSKFSPLTQWWRGLAWVSLLTQLISSTLAQSPAPPVSIINVVPAKNNTSQPDEDGAFPAMIILRNSNPTSTTVNLSVDIGGWFLSDDPANPTKWKVPDKTIIAPQGQLIIFASGKDRRPAGGDGRLHTNFIYPCEVPFAGLYDPKPTLVSQFSKPDPQCAEACRGVSVFTPNALARYLVPKDKSIETVWVQPGFDDKGWETGPLGIGYDDPRSSLYAPLIGTDVTKQMKGVNPSIYIRIPFSVPNPSLVGKLDLALNYDDGFVCYLNGVEVARRNAPLPAFLPFDSTSLTDRPDTAALTVEAISLTSKIHLLVPGENLIAIQGLNSAKDAARFVIRPQLCMEQTETRDCPKTSNGRDFWLTFPGNAPQDTNNPLHLTVCITGVPGTSGKVEVPGLGFGKSFTITTNGPVAGTGCVTVEIPSDAALEDNRVVQKKGVHIIADRDVAVYGTSRIDYSTDTFLALPSGCLGRDYVALGYKNAWSSLPILNGTQFGLVAVFDGTRVSIDPSKSAAGGAPFQIVLNRGETYLVRDTADAPSDLSGALIGSSLPVGVFAGHRCANVNGKDIFFCNLALEQLLPTPTWGTEYVTAPLRTRTHSVPQSKGDTLRVIAASNGTAIFITDDTGVKNANLNAGQVHEQLVIGPARVVARGPVLAALYSNSSDFDQVTNSDPFMALLQPVPNWLSRYLVCAPPTIGGSADFEESYVNIITRGTNDAALIQLNGAPVTGFQPVGSSGYFYAQIILDSSLTQHLIDSPRGARFAVTVYGFSEFDAYGYPGGFGFNQAVPATIVCPSDVVIELKEGCQAPAPDLREKIQVIDPCAEEPEPPNREACFDFDDLPFGTEFKVAQSFTATGSGQSISVTVAPFIFSNGQSTSNGSAIVRNGGQAGDTGNEIQVNNVNLVFKPANPVPQFSVLFGEFGGNINLSVNGILRNEADFALLNGATVGGAQISVTTVAGARGGELRVLGTVTEFAIGGQELFIDHLCVGGSGQPPGDSCFEFEDLKLETEFKVRSAFATSDAAHTETISGEGQPFTFSNGQSTSSGRAIITNAGRASSTGNEIQVNNILLFFKPANSWPGFSILYGEFGGNVNFAVNGELKNVLDFPALNGLTLGGAQISVVSPTTSARGEIRVTGTVRDFAIGGQELFIDHLCVKAPSTSTSSGNFGVDGASESALVGLVVTQNPPPGTPLAVGENEIVLTVRGSQGQLIGSCVTLVRVRDGSPVKLECPKELFVKCQDEKGARVFYDGVRAFTEKCGQPIAVTCDPPSASFLPAGTTIVKCAVPGAGAECSFPVHVVCEAPQISLAVLDGKSIRLTWQTGGTLETADSVGGPWRVIPGVQSGYLVETTGPGGFFRLRF